MAKKKIMLEEDQATVFLITCLSNILALIFDDIFF